MTKHISETRTESLALELLAIQQWGLSKPPKGNLIRQNEYKAFYEIGEIFKGKSKSGSGDGYPDFLMTNNDSRIPVMVIEAKADENHIDQALDEACEYGNACRSAGHEVLAVGIAGQEKTGIKVLVAKFVNDEWVKITYNTLPISWVPSPEDSLLLLANQEKTDLAPVVPKPEVLAEKADEINRILREADVKDEFRAAYMGAFMLALWESKGRIRRDPDYVLQDINNACERAYTHAGKFDLARSLHIDEANGKLASKAWKVISTLEKLNVVTASVSHDYLGQLYESFFRYTGANTIGQYFTPRHIARFMADITEISPTDKVLDPACGTGGFLISALQRSYENLGIKYEDAVDIIKSKLFGYESEPITAALCVANMILRGDGKTGIRRADCFLADDYPIGGCQVVLMNPPFPHKNTDVPPQQFVERALEALETRGRLAVILPSSLLVKSNIGDWRKKILENNTLLAVCQLPDELFQPNASATTSIVMIEKGIPHGSGKKTTFVRLRHDGLTLKKRARVERADKKNDLAAAADAILNKVNIPGFSGVANISGSDEWSPGAYIPAAVPTEEELRESLDELLRKLASFYIRYASEIARQRSKVAKEELRALPYREMLGSSRLANANILPKNEGTIGELFDLYYGQKELHSRDGIPPGDSLIISPTESYNGCYGWLSFENLIQPPFITVAQTGSIGEAFVQLEPCGVNDDCLVLMSKEDKNLSVAHYLTAAAVIRLEKWRFNYGRKLTPSRIANFKYPTSAVTHDWVEKRLEHWRNIIDSALLVYAQEYEVDGDLLSEANQ